MYKKLIYSAFRGYKNAVSNEVSSANISQIDQWNNHLERLIGDILDICSSKDGTCSPPPYVLEPDSAGTLDDLINSFLKCFEIYSPKESPSYYWKTPMRFLFKCPELPLDFFTNDTAMQSFPNVKLFLLMKINLFEKFHSPTQNSRSKRIHRI